MLWKYPELCIDTVLLYTPLSRRKIYRDVPRLVSWTATCSKQNDSRGNMSMHGAAKTHPVIVAVIRLQSITIISCLRIPIAIIIPTLWLKIKVILRLCATVSRFYIGPMLLFYQTAQIKPTNYKCLFFLVVGEASQPSENSIQSETVRCRKLILGRDIGFRGCRCATSWCGLDLTFDLAIVTLTYRTLARLYLGNHKV